MTIAHTRRENTRRIAASIGGQAAFSRRLGVSRQQVNHIIGSTTVKQIGDRLARRIESTFGYPIGWLDTMHEADIDRAESQSAFVDVPAVDTNALLDNQGPKPEQAIEHLRLAKTWIGRHINSSSFAHLAVFHVNGDSMEPTINNGDTVIIDRAASSISADGLYLTGVDGVALVKRAQRLPRSVRLTSDNKHYAPISLNSEQQGELLVLGRVVGLISIRAL